jgi:nucleoside-diphosphate-sugar epimerase
VARVLIVGCGCRGRALAGELLAEGHAVRGTTRDPTRIAAIEATGAEGVVADPDRLGTITGQLAGVSALCWLMGSVDEGAATDLHGPRLRTLLERLVDTPVRGMAYEAAGRVDAEILAAGAASVRGASATWRMPAEVVTADPGDHDAWLAAMTAAVKRLL